MCWICQEPSNASSNNMSPFFDLRYQNGRVIHYILRGSSLIIVQNIYEKLVVFVMGMPYENTKAAWLFQRSHWNLLPVLFHFQKWTRFGQHSPQQTVVFPKPPCPHTVLPHSCICMGCSFAVSYHSELSSAKTFLSQTKVIPVKLGFIVSLAHFVDNYSQGKYLSCFSQSHFYTCQIASPFPTPFNAHEDPIVSFRSIS